MTERMLELERTVQALQRELEYLQPTLPAPHQVRRSRTAITYDDGNYPTEPKGSVLVLRGIAESGTATTINLQTVKTPFGPESSALDDEYNGRTLRIVGGMGKGQAFPISDYVGSSRQLTITGTFSPVPDSTSEYSIEMSYPVIFLDKDAGRRQNVARKSAIQLGGRYLPPNSLVKAVEIEGQWFIVDNSGEGSICIPLGTIPAASRTVRAGSDKFSPGVGEVCLYHWDDELDEIVPSLHADGSAIIKRVLNLTDRSFEGGAGGALASHLATLSGDRFQTLDGQNLLTTLSIDPDSDVLFAKVDRRGEMILDGIEGASGGSTKIARNGGTKIDKINTGTNTPGSGTVTVWEFAGAQLVATPQQLTAYNWTNNDCPANEFVLLEQEVASGNWLIVMDGQHTIEGYATGTDGQETLFEYDTLRFVGDRDVSSVVGNIIDCTISKAGDVVTVNIDATGGLFTITDSQSPTPGTAVIDLGDDLDLSTSIDETLTSVFSEFRVTDVASDPAINLVFGKVFDVTADTGSEDIFPLETFNFAGGTNVTTNVQKAGDIVTVTINASGTGSWIARDNQSTPNNVTIDAAETLQFLSAIDETQNDDWLLWEVVEANPDTLTATFGKMLIAEDGDLDTQNFYPRETLRLRGDRDVSAVVGNIIETEVTKAGDVIIFDINATGGLVTISDDDSPTPDTAVLDLGDTLKFITSNPAGQTHVSKAGTTITVDIDLASSGSGFHTIRDGDADDQTLNDSEVFHIRGDRDVSSVLGNFIETEVTKPGGVVTLDINAVGNMFAFEEGDAPQDDTLNVAAGAVVSLSSTIDEAGLPNTFSQVRISGSNIIWAYGKMLEVEDDQSTPNTVTLFPTEKLKFEGPGDHYTVTKAGDTVTVTSSGSTSFNIEDERSTPQTITVGTGETLKLDSVIDEAGLPNTFSEFRVNAGAPEELELAFGKLLQIDGFSTGTDGTATLFPTEIIKIQGDRDQSVAVGNIIDVQISKAADTITVDINATGTLHTITDNRASPQSANIDLGDDLDLTTSIDETMLTIWSQWRVSDISSDPAADLVFGRMLIVEDDQASPNTANLFPTEKLKFDQTGSNGFTVSKAGDTVTVALAAGAGGGGAFTVEDERPSPQQITVDDGDTVKLDTVIDEVGLPTTFSQFRVNAGAPEEIELAFGRVLVISGFSYGADGLTSIFPEEELQIIGDRDQSAIPGNIIDVSVSKVGSTVQVNINATGGLFTVYDNNTPQGSAVVDLADNWYFTSSIDETLTTKHFEWEVSTIFGNVFLNATFGKVMNVKADTGSQQNLFPLENLHIQTTNPSGNASVTKVGDDIDVTIDVDGMPVGFVGWSTRAPVNSGGKWYMNNGSGGASTDWALMDGTSNSGPGSGIDLRGHFVRMRNDTGSPSDSHYGRSVATPLEDDEVRIRVNPHPDHVHTPNLDQCHISPNLFHSGTDTHYDYSTLAGNNTSIQKQTNGAPLTLDHTMNLTNHQGTKTPSTEHIKMLPPYKLLQAFERVSA